MAGHGDLPDDLRSDFICLVLFLALWLRIDCMYSQI